MIVKKTLVLHITFRNDRYMHVVNKNRKPSQTVSQISVFLAFKNTAIIRVHIYGCFEKN